MIFHEWSCGVVVHRADSQHRGYEFKSFMADNKKHSWWGRQRETFSQSLFPRKKLRALSLASIIVESSMQSKYITFVRINFSLNLWSRILEITVYFCSDRLSFIKIRFTIIVIITIII